MEEGQNNLGSLGKSGENGENVYLDESDLTFVGYQLGIFTERLGVIDLITTR